MTSVAGRRSGVDGRGRHGGVRKPLRHDAAVETDGHVDLHLTRRVEIEDGRFHADFGSERAFELEAEVLDEARQVVACPKRQPLDGVSVGARDGRERSPFVERSGLNRRCVHGGTAERRQRDKEQMKLHAAS